MDRLDEIRARCNAGRTVRIADVKYLLSEVDRLNALHKREIIVTGEYAQRVIDLTARAERAERERDAAVEDMVHDCSTCGCYEKCTDEWFKSDMNEDRCSCSDWQWRGPEAGKGKPE